MTSKPDLGRPRVGDELILYRRKGRSYPALRQTVRAKAVARFRVTLEALEGEDQVPWYLREFDLRSGRSWQNKDWTGVELHTEDTLAYQMRERAAEAALAEYGLYWRTDLRGALKRAADADLVAFANLLRRFAGEDEIR
jgi:hypothetical protein